MQSINLVAYCQKKEIMNKISVQRILSSIFVKKSNSICLYIPTHLDTDIFLDSCTYIY